MKKKIGFSVIFGTLCVITMFAQADPRPTSPQPMSSKTAMEYFRDEGITVGINVGNTFDAVDNWTKPGNPVSSETAWGNPRINQSYLTGLKNLGFDIIRIPVTWTGHIGPAPDYKVDEAYLRRIAEVANMARTAGLKAFINMHHDGNIDASGHGLGGWLDINAAVKGNTEISEKFEKVWEQIAAYFVNYGDWLMFQAFNEIHDGTWSGTGSPAQYNVINDWNQRFTNAVRRTGGNNAQRYLLYYGYFVSAAIAQSSSPFRLPNDTSSGRQIVGFHWYEPGDFAHDTTTHVWPNSSRNGKKADIDKVLKSFKTRFVDSGIPVIIGENAPARYSSHKNNPKYNAKNVQTARKNRLAYIDYLYSKARENGIVPFYWEPGMYDPNTNFADFSLINRNNGRPNSEESAEVIQHMIDATKR